MLPDFLTLELAIWIAGILGLCFLLGPILHWLTHPQWTDQDISLPEALRQVWKAEVIRPPRAGKVLPMSEFCATAASSEDESPLLQVNVRAKAMGSDPRFGG